MHIKTSHIKSIISLALLLLFAWAPTLEAKRTEDVTIPFELINGMIIMNLEVDGKQGAFLLDTGADAILIDGIPKKVSGEGVSTLGGEVAVEMRELANLKIGSLVQYGVSVQVMSLSLLEQNLGIDLFGIIGGAYFMPRSLCMDFTTSTITISDKPFGK
jgi:predicted aspartyl protease